MRQCEATAKSTGRRCNRYALPGQGFCAQHRRGAGAPTLVERRDGQVDEDGGAGLYAAQLTEALREDGLDREIALIRTKIGANLDKPEVVQKWVDLLIKGVRAHHQVSKKSEDGPSDRVVEVLREFGGQLLPDGSKGSAAGDRDSHHGDTETRSGGTTGEGNRGQATDVSDTEGRDSQSGTL